MSGVVLAQAIAFLISPILSRLFTPAAFGEFGAFSAVLSVAGAGITLDYVQAMMLAKDRAEAEGLLALSCVVTTALVLTLAIVLTCFPGLLLDLIGSERSDYVPLFILALLASGISGIFLAWCVRTDAVNSYSTVQVVRSLANSGSALGAGFLSPTPIVLIVASTIGDISSIAVPFRLVFGRRDRMQHVKLTWKALFGLAKNFKDFPLYSAPQSIVGAASQGLPVLLLSHSYGLSVSGAFVFGSRVIQVPFGLVQRSLRPVLFRRASQLFNDRHALLPLYLKMSGGLVLFAGLPALVVALSGPLLFSFVFGSNWELSGRLAQCVVLWLAASLCILPALQFGQILRRQRAMFLMDLTSLAVRSATLAVGGRFLTPVGTVLAFSLVGAGMGLFQWLYVLSLLRRYVPADPKIAAAVRLSQQST